MFCVCVFLFLFLSLKVDGASGEVTNVAVNYRAVLKGRNVSSFCFFFF